MPKLLISPVQSRRDQKTFLELPWFINRRDPNWIPPLRQNQAELVGFRHHPFYDDAEAQAFLALQHGRPVGRVLALVNRAHNRFHRRTGAFSASSSRSTTPKSPPGCSKGSAGGWASAASRRSAGR
jgi:hypothetical protein